MTSTRASFPPCFPCLPLESGQSHLRLLALYPSPLPPIRKRQHALWVKTRAPSSDEKQAAGGFYTHIQFSAVHSATQEHESLPAPSVEGGRCRLLTLLVINNIPTAAGWQELECVIFLSSGFCLQQPSCLTLKT